MAYKPYISAMRSLVSIPERGSAWLWRKKLPNFGRRFSVSIPERGSAWLWLKARIEADFDRLVSIPERGSAWLWPKQALWLENPATFQSLRGVQPGCGSMRWRRLFLRSSFQSLRGVQPGCGVLHPLWWGKPYRFNP